MFKNNINRAVLSSDGATEAALSKTGILCYNKFIKFSVAAKAMADTVKIQRQGSFGKKFGFCSGGTATSLASDVASQNTQEV